MSRIEKSVSDRHRWRLKGAAFAPLHSAPANNIDVYRYRRFFEADDIDLQMTLDFQAGPLLIFPHIEDSVGFYTASYRVTQVKCPACVRMQHAKQ